MSDTTTIRVSLDTRDRLNDLISDVDGHGEFAGLTTDQVISALLDFHWKTRAVEAAELYRREHPDEWRADLDQAERWTRTELADLNLDDTEGPYFRSREEYEQALRDHDRTVTTKDAA